MATFGFQDAITRWTVTPDGYGGYTYGTPEPLTGRWEEKGELFRDAKGEEVVSNAIAFVSADVAVGDFLYLGTSVLASPVGLAGAYQVRGFMKTHDIRRVDYLRKAYM